MDPVSKQLNPTHPMIRNLCQIMWFVGNSMFILAPKALHYAAFLNICIIKPDIDKM